MPLTPIAVPAVPNRQGLPKLSMIRTATSRPALSFSLARIRSAEASGSSGNNNARLSPPTFDRSIPALARMKPKRWATIKTPSRYRRTSLDSPRMSSTNLGSVPVLAARSIARADGTTVVRSIVRPSDLDTIFCAKTRTSPSHSRSPDASSAASVRLARSAPTATRQMPSSGRRSKPREFIASPVAGPREVQ